MFGSYKKSATYALSTTSKRVIQKRAEAAGDFICNKIANKITKVSTQNCSKTVTNETENIVLGRETYIKEDIYLQKTDSTLLMSQD